MIVETQRLILTPISVADRDDLVTIHGDTNVAAWYDGTRSEAVAEAWAVQMQAPWTDHGVGKWIARRKHDDVLIGRGGLSRTTLLEAECLEIGWTLRDKAQGRGYATEIGKAGLDFAFGPLGADEVFAFTEIHNASSRAVMERLRMESLGTIALPGLIEGQQGVHEDAPFALYMSRSAA